MTYTGWMNVEILSPNAIYPPGEGAPSSVYVSPEKCRYTMTCRSSSTPQKVQLTGWSSPPTATWAAPGSAAPGKSQVQWEAGVNIKNISHATIDGYRILICSYNATKAESWSHQPPPEEPDVVDAVVPARMPS